ncbi:MAG TPA: hypothetical protein GXX34_04850 [Clostridia bacterium]|nr:hypothetical protein [Clostridia bacterium]
MERHWAKKACWQKWIKEEQASLYTLAFFFARDDETALQLTREAVTLAYQAEPGWSKAVFLRAVADQMCRLQGKYSPPEQDEAGELAQVTRVLLHMEGELRLLVLFYCVLQFDRRSLAEKLGWPPARLDAKLNEALAVVNRSFLRQKLLVTQ